MDKSWKAWGKFMDEIQASGSVFESKPPFLLSLQASLLFLIQAWSRTEAAQKQHHSWTVLPQARYHWRPETPARLVKEVELGYLPGGWMKPPQGLLPQGGR